MKFWLILKDSVVIGVIPFGNACEEMMSFGMERYGRSVFGYLEITFGGIVFKGEECGLLLEMEDEEVILSWENMS